MGPWQFKVFSLLIASYCMVIVTMSSHFPFCQAPHQPARRPLAQAPYLIVTCTFSTNAKDEPVALKLTKHFKPGIALNLGCKRTTTKKIISTATNRWGVKVQQEDIRIC
jgi:hypothetical protein